MVTRWRLALIGFALFSMVALSGCPGYAGYCKTRNPDQLGALLQGFLCLGTPPNQGESASISVDPPSPFVNQEVRFTASASASFSPFIYEWDLDGDGTFELATGDPTVSTIYDSPGRRTVGLRVQDFSGERTLGAQRRVTVKPYEPEKAAAQPTAATAKPDPGTGGRASGRRGRPFRAKVVGLSTPRRLGSRKTVGPTTRFNGIVAKGRMAAKGRFGPFHRFRRARWLGRATAFVNGSTERVRMRAPVLVRFGKGKGVACVRLKVRTTPGGRNAAKGRLKILGGRGRAARLRGSAKFRVQANGRSALWRGRAAIRNGRPRSLPRLCRPQRLRRK